MSTLSDFLDRYADEVYGARDAQAARRFIADPCLRHECGSLVAMSIDDNVARIADFLRGVDQFDVTNACFVEAGEFATSCYDITTSTGVISGIEVFRVVDGLIVEAWNSVPAHGPWG
jgi:predicted SnoaL-like aldol condensation-catalyzing enzyme